mgnify:CR=1 FL=1
MELSKFTEHVWSFYKDHNRSFPWRETTDPYEIMVSEFMLQQTQTDRVVPKYEEFLNSFPSIETLAKASQSEVLKYWQGLGYNRRALYLHRTANEIRSRFNGIFPENITDLETLPGIGPYTSAAIATFAFNQPHVFIETNIRTVYIHHFFEDKEGIDDTQLMPLIEETLDQQNPREWYYALMDYGSYLKKQHPNPNRKSKHYTKQSKFEGSLRQVRGAILRELIDSKHSKSPKDLHLYDSYPPSKVKLAINSLEKDGFIIKDQNTISLKK